MGIEVRLNPAVARVITAVLADYGLSYEQLVAPNKVRSVLEARYMVCWLTKQLHPEIGEVEVAWSVKRELNMIRSGVRRLERDMEQQVSLRARADTLLAALRPKAVSNG